MAGITEVLMCVWILAASQVSGETVLVMDAPGGTYDTWRVQILCASQGCHTRTSGGFVMLPEYYCPRHDEKETNNSHDMDTVEIEHPHQLVVLRLHPGSYQILARKNGGGVIKTPFQCNAGLYSYKLGGAPPASKTPPDAAEAQAAKRARELEVEAHTKNK
jgi:hypothetical protein